MPFLKFFFLIPFFIIIIFLIFEGKRFKSLDVTTVVLFIGLHNSWLKCTVQIYIVFFFPTFKRQKKQLIINNVTNYINRKRKELENSFKPKIESCLHSIGHKRRRFCVFLVKITFQRHFYFFSFSTTCGVQ